MNHSTKRGCLLQQAPQISREISDDLHWWKSPKGMDQIHHCQNQRAWKALLQFDKLKVHITIQK